MDLNFSAVKQILDQTLEPQSTGTHLMIFDQNGEVIYHTDGGEDLWSRISEEEKEQLTGLVLSDDRENNGRETEEVRIEGKGAAASVTKTKARDGEYWYIHLIPTFMLQEYRIYSVLRLQWLWYLYLP